MSLITAYDVKAPNLEVKKKKASLKAILLKILLYCLLPILGPIWFLVVLTLIGTQGLVSRYRASRLLTSYQIPSLVTSNSDSSSTTLNHRRKSEVDKYVDGGVLAGALDALNLPGDTSPPLLRRSSSHPIDPQDENAYYFKVKPGKDLESNAQPLELDAKTMQIYKNLNLLSWERVWIYIRGFNAHGSIVCRNKMYTTDGGEATIRHFIDTTQF